MMKRFLIFFVMSIFPLAAIAQDAVVSAADFSSVSASVAGRCDGKHEGKVSGTSMRRGSKPNGSTAKKAAKERATAAAQSAAQTNPTDPSYSPSTPWKKACGDGKIPDTSKSPTADACDTEHSDDGTTTVICCFTFPCVDS